MAVENKVFNMPVCGSKCNNHVLWDVSESISMLLSLLSVAI